MAIHRTYIVQMPGTGFLTTDLDIVVAVPGSNTAPVAYGTSPPRTAPPAGWGGSPSFDGAYYEWRGRTILIPVLSTAGGSLATGIQNGFVPRARLGFTLSINQIENVAAAAILPKVLISKSLIGTFDDTVGVINAADLADPTYGPVIRLKNAAAVATLIYVVNFSIYEAKDEDRDPTGSV